MAIEPGSVVMLGDHRGPEYTVVAISGERAWIRPLSYGSEGIAPLDLLRPVIVSPVARTQKTDRVSV